MVEHVGNKQSELRLSAHILFDGVGPSGGRLSQTLHLVVLDETRGLTIYEGPISGLKTLSAGVFGPNETHTVTFTVSRPGPKPPASSVLLAQQDDSSSSDALAVAFEWEDSD